MSWPWGQGKNSLGIHPNRKAGSLKYLDNIISTHNSFQKIHRIKTSLMLISSVVYECKII